MQRLFLAFLILGVLAGLVAVFGLGLRSFARDRQAGALELWRTQGVRKLAYVTLLLVIGSAALGLLGGF